MKQKKSKIMIVAIWILLYGCMMCMSSCGSLLYNPSNKAEQTAHKNVNKNDTSIV